MKIAEYRRKLAETLASVLPDESRYIADMLLCEALSASHSELLAKQLEEAPPSVDPFISGAVMELSLGKPLQYVLGRCNFYGYEIEVGDGVFIPRSETEIGVRAALGVLKDGGLFADICSGSGCIAKAIASENPKVSGYALELSRKALKYTEKNLADCRNVSVRRFDALDEDDYVALAAVLERPLDLVICNPPYIPTDDIATLDTQVRYEPESALDGGEDGLRYYRAVTEYAQHLLKRDGVLIYEIGIGQLAGVSAILRAHGYEIAVMKDYGKIDRIILAKKY